MIRFASVSYTYPFHDTPAVQDISFTVRPGELVLCTGVSGCGKTTLMRLANGLCPHYYQGRLNGNVFVNGVSTAYCQLSDLADVVGTLLQNPEDQFFALEVEDELAFAHECRGRDAADIAERIRGVAEDFALGPLLGASVHELSQGQKQKVGLASVLSQRPRALILDEPTANLDPESARELAGHLARLKRRGMAILVVDHRLSWLEQVADRVLVMDRGRVVEEGPFSLVRDDALRHRYGLRQARVEDPRPRLPEAGDCAGAALEIAGLTFGYPGREKLFTDAFCRLPRGVTAVVGDNGRGKTTLARLLTGLLKAESGAFFLHGAALAPDALLQRSSIVLQNTDHQLYMRSVLEEVGTCLRLGAAKGHRLEQKEEEVRALEILERFGLRHLAGRHPQSLSGGEKQRLVIACALAKQPDVLILDEPTSGLDGRNMRRIAEALEESAARGACVLVITHDLELMADVCASALRLPLSPAPALSDPYPSNRREK